MVKLIIGCLLMMSFVANAQSNKALYFQPTFANGLTADKLFEAIEYIPLETTKKSVFGKIRQLIVSNQYFIIWDSDTNSIYFFDKTGKFIKKYRPPKCIIKTIQLDKDRNALFISGNNKNYTFSQIEIEKMMENPTDASFAKFVWSGFYDLNDVQKEKIEVLQGFSLALVNPVFFNKNFWAYSNIFASRKRDSNTDYELKIYNGSKNINQYFPYNKKDETIFYSQEQISFFRTNNNNALLFTRPYNYSIYELTKDSTRLLYTLVLPMENALPQSFFNHPFRSSNDFEEYKKQNGGYAWGINKVFKIKDFLFFSLDSKKSFRERNFFLDESTGRFYNTSKINSDSSNAYLPILSDGIKYSDEDYLYGSFSSSTMFQAYDRARDRNPQYSSSIKQYFENNNREANPVIIQLKLKNKIE